MVLEEECGDWAWNTVCFIIFANFVTSEKAPDLWFSSLLLYKDNREEFCPSRVTVKVK